MMLRIRPHSIAKVLKRQARIMTYTRHSSKAFISGNVLQMNNCNHFVDLKSIVETANFYLSIMNLMMYTDYLSMLCHDIRALEYKYKG